MVTITMDNRDEIASSISFLLDFGGIFYIYLFYKKFGLTKKDAGKIITVDDQAKSTTKIM